MRRTSAAIVCHAIRAVKLTGAYLLTRLCPSSPVRMTHSKSSQSQPVMSSHRKQREWPRPRSKNPAGCVDSDRQYWYSWKIQNNALPCIAKPSRLCLAQSLPGTHAPCRSRPSQAFCWPPSMCTPINHAMLQNSMIQTNNQSCSVFRRSRVLNSVAVVCTCRVPYAHCAPSFS